MDLYNDVIKTATLNNIVLRCPFKKDIEGSVCITPHHLIASSRDTSEEIMLLIKNIDAVEYKQTGAYCLLVLRCKDFQVLTLQMPVSSEARNLLHSLEKLKDIEDIHNNYRHLFPFSYTSKSTMIKEDGWTAFLPDAEFAHLVSSNDWRICQANSDYSLCKSYPSAVLVPSTIDDDIVRASARFRQGGRFPVLAYCHKEKGAFLMRSSQPIVTGSSANAGITRCREDEKILNTVLDMSKNLRGMIIDHRTQAQRNAQVKSGGGGLIEQFYPQWRNRFMPLETAPVLQESFRQLLNACQASASISVDKWLNKLDACGWLGHIKAILNTACMAAQTLDREGFSVLVQGCEGTDATLQITSLVQVILHADCRTIRGFEALIDREWIQAGHPFRSRCKNSAFSKSSVGTEAPVFILFLDCVWQIWRQFPGAFEFSEDLLIFLARHAYASEFGTFISENQKEARAREVDRKTVSLWSYLSNPSVLEEFMNPLYEPCQAQRHLYACWPSVAVQSLGLWEDLYLVSVIDPEPREIMRRQIREIRDEQLEAKQRVIKLRRILVGLQHDALAEGVLPNTENDDNVVDGSRHTIGVDHDQTP